MADIQQIIDALGCFTTSQHSCTGYPFNPHPGKEWAYGCIRGQNDIVKAARATLKKCKEILDDGETQGDSR